MGRRAETTEPVLAELAEQYCGSQWAHKPHRWYDSVGASIQCPGATTAEKPNKGDPRTRS